MNVGLLLAAGESKRFQAGSPKQIYDINGKSMVSYSIETLSSTLDELVIVTNRKCYKQIRDLAGNHPVLINDVDCRLQSIKIGLDYIETAGNIVIHDAARPFVEENQIQQLLTSARQHLYAQFYLKLVNGLLRKTETGYEVVDRSHFIELVTPQIMDYRLLMSIFTNHIDVTCDSEDCEIIPVLDGMKIKYDLIEGSARHLRKITTIDDL